MGLATEVVSGIAGACGLVTAVVSIIVAIKRRHEGMTATLAVCRYRNCLTSNSGRCRVEIDAPHEPDWS